MPLFRLSENIEFPPAWLARNDGLLCIGGDLSIPRLLLAYERGIFPWFSKDEPILWWSPDPRLVLFPDRINISRSLQKTIRKKAFQITLNTDFKNVIHSCARSRTENDEGTWLVNDMIEAYLDLHKAGFAHSIEIWKNHELVGGLYGVCLGGSFFGESMFSCERDASKVALVALTKYVSEYQFDLIDCQITTDHLLKMGAVEIPRNKFLSIINKSIKRGEVDNIWEKKELTI